MKYKFFIVALPTSLALLMTFIGYKVLSHIPEVPEQEPEVPAEVELVDVEDYMVDSSRIVASGSVEAVEEVLLSAEVSSVIEDLDVEIGDSVEAGEVLVSFDTDIYDIQLMQAAAGVERAKANYDLVMAGATDGQIAQAAAAVAQAEAAVAQAEASYEQSELQAQASIDSAEAALETAEINLDLDPEEDAYESLVISMQSIYVSLRNMIYDADAILGIDDASINDDFERGLGTMDENALNSANRNYEYARDAILYEADIVQDLDIDDDEDDIEDALDELEEAMEKTEELYEDLKDVMDATVSFSGLSQAELDAYRDGIAANLTTLNSFESTLNSGDQAIESAQDAEESYEIAYDNAELQLEQAEDAYGEILNVAEASIDSAEAALDSAQAAYYDIVDGPRNVDVAAYLAAIKEATAAYQLILEQRSHAQVVAPISGQIASITAEEGEFVGAGTGLITLVNADALQVRATISSKDIDKVETGMEVTVNDRYEGEVYAISPVLGSSNKVEVLIALEDVDGLLSGEIVEVEMKPKRDSEQFFLPLAAVKTTAAGAYVFMVEDGEIVEHEVEIGEVSGDQIEILDGLEEGDEILPSLRGYEAGQEVTLKS